MTLCDSVASITFIFCLFSIFPFTFVAVAFANLHLQKWWMNEWMPFQCYSLLKPSVPPLLSPNITQDSCTMIISTKYNCMLAMSRQNLMLLLHACSYRTGLHQHVKPNPRSLWFSFPPLCCYQCCFANFVLKFANFSYHGNRIGLTKFVWHP